jgi:hypothetical protein
MIYLINIHLDNGQCLRNSAGDLLVAKQIVEEISRSGYWQSHDTGAFTFYPAHRIKSVFVEKS